MYTKTKALSSLSIHKKPVKYLRMHQFGKTFKGKQISIIGVGINIANFQFIP